MLKAREAPRAGDWRPLGGGGESSPRPRRSATSGRLFPEFPPVASSGAQRARREAPGPPGGAAGRMVPGAGRSAVSGALPSVRRSPAPPAPLRSAPAGGCGEVGPPPRRPPAPAAGGSRPPASGRSSRRRAGPKPGAAPTLEAAPRAAAAAPAVGCGAELQPAPRAPGRRTWAQTAGPWGGARPGGAGRTHLGPAPRKAGADRGLPPGREKLGVPGARAATLETETGSSGAAPGRKLSRRHGDLRDSWSPGLCPAASGSLSDVQLASFELKWATMIVSDVVPNPVLFI